MESRELPMIDHAALRTHQASLIAFLLLAFVANSIWLLAVVVAAMLAGTALRRPGFLPVYWAVRRLHLVSPERLHDHPEPHRFAQLVGGVFVAAGLVALLLGWSVIGWALAWIVVGLAGLNLFGGFCVGCAIYYWLNRLGVPGFKQSPPAGTSPGHRPTTHARSPM